MARWAHLLSGIGSPTLFFEGRPTVGLSTGLGTLQSNLTDSLPQQQDEISPTGNFGLPIRIEFQ